MNAWAETLLNKLERSATKRGPIKTPFQRWLVRLSPDSTLLPAETYSWPLFFRVASPPGCGVVLFFAFGQAVIWGALWYYRPELFNNPKYHKLLIGLLSREGVYWMPLALVSLLLFNYTLYLPRRYFWNRPAARLRREPPEPVALAVDNVEADPGVWPPAPRAH